MTASTLVLPFSILTLARGTNAPAGSLTIPVRVAVSNCPYAAADSSRMYRFLYISTSSQGPVLLLAHCREHSLPQNELIFVCRVRRGRLGIWAVCRSRRSATDHRELQPGASERCRHWRL